MFDKIVPEIMAQEKKLKAMFSDTQLRELENFLARLKNQP